MGVLAGEAAVAAVVDLARRCQPPTGMGPAVIAIDGLGGAGKSTLAVRASRALAGTPMVHTDDFASWDDPLRWWPRLLEQVLRPLSEGHAACYQRYDWDERRLAEWRELSPCGLLILEGVGCSRRELRGYLAAAVWVAAAQPERLRRGLARDGEDAHDRWAQWQAEEDRYLTRDRPDQAADLVVDGENGDPWPGPERPDKVR